MTGAQITAIEAFAKNCLPDGRIRRLSTAFVCPFDDCRSFAQHHWGRLTGVTPVVDNVTHQTRLISKAVLVSAICENCLRDVIFLDGKIVKPAPSEAPTPNPDMPPDVLVDYQEAAEIMILSPRGAAALLRLCVQKFLPQIGAPPGKIDDQISFLVKSGQISSKVQMALDTLRVIGNEAVHPGVIDLKDDLETVSALFRLLNFIVEKTISEPKHAEELFGSLPAGKIDAIKRRDGQT